MAPQDFSTSGRAAEICFRAGGIDLYFFFFFFGVFSYLLAYLKILRQPQKQVSLEALRLNIACRRRRNAKAQSQNTKQKQ